MVVRAAGTGNSVSAKKAVENGGWRTRRAAHVATRLVLLLGAACDEMAHEIAYRFSSTDGERRASWRSDRSGPIA